MNPLLSVKGSLITGFVIAVLFAVLSVNGGVNFNELGLARWLHIIAGITWIGLLYYFNAVQVPALATAAADKGGPGGAGITKYVAPLALLWFGLGKASLIFVLIHAVLWPLSLNTHSGFMSVSETLRMAGRNYGLKGLGYVARILIPAAFPSILAGLKIAWAFAWRTLIAAELVFGVSSGKGGLGWYIYENKNMLEIPAVFAGLFTVILIGLTVENLIFRNIEAATVRRWGMQT